MKNNILISILLPIFLSIFISVFAVPATLNSNFSITHTNNQTNNTSYIWPTPGYNKITSKFGNRTSPTNRCINISRWNWHCSTRKFKSISNRRRHNNFCTVGMEQMGIQS